jgi:hypothetical protein
MKPNKLLFLIFLTGFLLVWSNFAEARPLIDERLGVSHVAGSYPVKYENFLLWGAQDAFRLGFQTIEIYLSPEICLRNARYPRPYGYYQTLDWCDPSLPKLSIDYKGIVDLIKHPRYQLTLSLPFKTVIITTETIGPAHAWGIAGYNREFTQTELDSLYSDFYQLTLYILEKYKNSSKTFIIQTPNELDWQLISNKGGASNPDAEPDDFAIKNAINYLNTIQKAIDDAKSKLPPEGMKIYHSCELNLIKKAMAGKKSATNSVVPYTHCDLYGYSSYETALLDNDYDFPNALNYLKNKAPDSPDFGNNNVFISEIGSPENQKGTQWSIDKMKLRFQQALNLGVPYIVFWQIYDNECSIFNPTSNSQCVGYWIRKPDGSLSSFYNEVFSKSPYLIGNEINNAQFVSQNIPSQMIAGKSYPVSITFKNTGNTIWTKNKLIRLGSQNPQDNLNWGIGRVELNSGESIAPNNTKTFNFNITAPSNPGTYNFQWQMLQEQIEWFGDKTLNVQINVIKDDSGSCLATPPTNLNETNLTATSVRLNWAPGINGLKQLLMVGTDLDAVKSGCPNGTGPGTGCIIKEDNLPTTQNSYSIVSGLTANTIYYWRVVTFNSASCYKDASKSFTTPFTATTSPSVPTNLQATPVSSSQINLSWTASTDNVGVAGYKIYRCQGSGCSPTTQIATTTTTSYQDTGLTANTSYTYAVSAYDSDGNVSDKSRLVSAKTLSSPINQCSPASVLNGTVSPYPDCKIICNRGYVLSANSCVAISGGGGGGGGRAPSPTPTPSPAPTSTPTPTPTSTSTPTLLEQLKTEVQLTQQSLLDLISMIKTNPKNPEIPTQLSAISNTVNTLLVKLQQIQGKPTTFIFARNLYLGSQGNDVKKLQEFLAKDKTIYPEGEITGYFGLLTKKAVQRFQCKYNIVCSGTPYSTGYGAVGFKTRTKLNELIQNQ